MNKKLGYLIFGAVGIMMAVYLSCDLFDLWDSRPLKFITSAVVTAYGLTGIRKKESRFISVALLFTLLADVFFVLRNEFIFGVATFVFVQLSYTAHFSLLSSKPLVGELLKRLIPGIIGAMIIIVATGEIKPAITILYACTIAVNFAHAVELQVKKPSKANRMLFWGFVLLGIGDVCVGFRNLSAPFVTEKLQSLCYFITWLSYPPSQLLIFESSRKTEK